jgi:hypothetical protein
MRQDSRRGTVLPTLGVCLISLFGFVALAVDLGMLAVSRTQCQNAADVAALVGARNLNNQEGTTDTNRAAALDAARAAAKANPHLSHYVNDSEIATITTGQYKYDPNTQRFSMSYPPSIASGDSWSAVHVELSATPATYFMRVMGVTTMPTGAAATAVHRPRDIAFVLDFTGSMAYGSTLKWPNDMINPSEGLMNPDPAYPKFGHYSRYTYYQNTSTGNAGSSTVIARPNPLQMKGTYSDSSGSYAPANHTMSTGGGPPVVEDFLTAPGDPSSVSQTTLVKNAFKMWLPSQTAPADTSSLTPASFDYTGYNAMTAACPAPDNFDVQADSPIAYAGDKWPRIDGSRGGQAAAWSTLSGNNFTDNGAFTLKQFLGSSLGARSPDLTFYTLPNGAKANTLLANGNNQDGGDTDANYYDSIWEKYGYDLDVSFLRAQAGFTNKTVKVDAGSFQGYSMGPGYWGKTFFIWPPDPRFEATANLSSPSLSNPAFDTNGKAMCDWRRRFFLRGDGNALDPQSDNINAILFTGIAGHTLNAVVTSVTPSFTASNCPGYYRLNYPAIIAWLKAGPQTLPTNLRSGRILYYSSMPADLTLGAPGDANDKMFWREYVHFLFGVGVFDASNAPLASWGFPTSVGYSPQVFMAGVESRNPFGTLSNTATASFTPTGSMAQNPKPYMSYTDNVNRPRMHFWFGPQSMMQFIKLSSEDRPWWSGTTHESQCWQLKAAVNSVLDDIKRNHPNDYCGVAGFATRGNFSTPLAPMGQDWYSLKNSLFFRKDAVADMKAKMVAGSNPQMTTSTVENRPYTPTFGDDIDQVPNSKGGTDANSGLALAFNMLSSSPTLISSGNYSNGGRRGAAKMVIFETDGRPSAKGRWFVTGTGVDTRYFNNPNNANPEQWTLDPSLTSFSKFPVKVVERLTAPVSATATSGFSLPNAPARVYAIAFGDIFNGYDTGAIGQEGSDALRFLLRVQQVGNTSPGTVGTADPPSASIPPEQIITGSYDVRITKLKSALERITQSGVQVTLIE